jgi:hypothetical protein
MAEESQQETVKQEAADPYGDVALGVECAWPQPSRGDDPALGAPVMKIQLSRGEAMPVRDGAGGTVHAHEGRVWITEEDTLADVVLGAGESFRLARRGLAVVEALSDASISIRFQL